MAVPRFDPPWLKTHAARKVQGSMFYRTGVIADRSFTLRRNRDFRHFLLLRPWLWPDDLHIRNWPVFPRAMPDVRKWTSCLKAFDSYRLTDIQTDRLTDTTEIIYHAASRVVHEICRKKLQAVARPIATITKHYVRYSWLTMSAIRWIYLICRDLCW